MNLNRYKTLEQLAEAINTLLPSSTSSVVAYFMTNAGQSISDSTTTIVDFEDQKYDTHSLVTTGASWKFTASSAGYYAVKAGILFTGSTAWAKAEQGILSAYVDGALFCHLDYRMEFISGGTSVAMDLSGTTVINLAASSYVDIRIYQGTGGALALDSGADAQKYNYVAIWKV
jgi:hypothetical protein